MPVWFQVSGSREAPPMSRMPTIAVIAVLVANGAATSAANDRPARSGWYLGAGLGVGQVSDLKQEGWNRDTFCYPDAACFDKIPPPNIPGYRWHYDIAGDRGAAFELSFGRYFGRTRLELALAQQANDTRQIFTGIAYHDGVAIRPRAGGTVASNGHGTIDRRRVRSVSLDAYYDFPDAWGTISPYVGVGLGQAFVEFSGVRFASDYRNTKAAVEAYNPPLPFYNSVQDADLDDTTLVWRVHAGADYALSRKSAIGLRLTWSETGDTEAVGGYETHPMHGIDPAFTNTNAFSGAHHWMLMLTFRRGIGE